METKTCCGDSSDLGCSSSCYRWVKGHHLGALVAPFPKSLSNSPNNFGQTPLPLSLVFSAASENRCLEINIPKYTVDCLPYLKVYLMSISVHLSVIKAMPQAASDQLTFQSNLPFMISQTPKSSTKSF